MSDPLPSEVLITYDGDDITDYVLLNSASFEAQANAMPGSFSFIVKDVDRSLTFTTGKEVYLYLDGVKFFGGIVMNVARQYAFPVVDTSTIADVTARQWRIEGLDFNVWFDKRVIRNLDNPTQAIVTSGVHSDQTLICDYMPNYFDLPPGVTVSRDNVEKLAWFGEKDIPEGIFKKRYAWVNLGNTWRSQMEEFANRSAAVFYIDAEKRLHFHGLETEEVSFAFVDRAPNGTNRIACRSVTATQDGSPIVTDALAWGGLESEGEIYFSRYPEAPASEWRHTFIDEHTGEETTSVFTAAQEQDALNAQDEHGIWQRGEQRFQAGETQAGLDLRVRYIISGPPGSQAGGNETSGLRYPQWQIQLTWFAHDLPTSGGIPVYIHPGNLVWIILSVMGRNASTPLTQFLPLRNVSVSFPTLKEPRMAWVQFNGNFGLQYSNLRKLWEYLLKRKKEGFNTRANQAGPNNTTVTNTSESSNLGSYAHLVPNESPDGARTTFTFPFPLLTGSIQLFVNGLLWRQGYEYSVTGPKEITFGAAPAADDQVWIDATAGDG